MSRHPYKTFWNLPIESALCTDCGSQFSLGALYRCQLGDNDPRCYKCLESQLWDEHGEKLDYQPRAIIARITGTYVDIQGDDTPMPTFDWGDEPLFIALTAGDLDV